MRYLLTLLAAILLPSLAVAQDAAAAPIWDWTPILQALAGTLVTILSALLVMLSRAALRFLDSKTGWHTEQRYAAVARRRVLALEGDLHLEVLAVAQARIGPDLDLRAAPRPAPRWVLLCADDDPAPSTAIPPSGSRRLAPACTRAK